MWSNATDSDGHQPQNDDAVCTSVLFVQTIPNKYYTKYFSYHTKVIRTLSCGLLFLLVNLKMFLTVQQFYVQRNYG